MTDTRKDGGPAFPVCPGEASFEQGMSLRDWFAGHALTGLTAHGPHPDLSRLSEGELTAAFAKAAYGMADAMLVEREKEKP